MAEAFLIQTCTHVIHHLVNHVLMLAKQGSCWSLYQAARLYRARPGGSDRTSKKISDKSDGFVSF
jgi:hypothetical protein